MQDVLLLSGCRTAIGGFGGVTKDVPRERLGAVVIRVAGLAARPLERV